MNGRAWQAIVLGVTRVGHDFGTRQPPPSMYSRFNAGNSDFSTQKKDLSWMRHRLFPFVRGECVSFILDVNVRKPRRYVRMYEY